MIDDHQDTEAFVLAGLALIRNGILLPWTSTCILLRAIDQCGYWRRDADSFTNWINHHSGELKINPPSLWRFFAAGRYYESLQSEYPEICPLPLEQLPSTVSPENLELLHKIARLAPKDVVSTLLEKTLSGKARRSELRSAWLVYRPIMDGKTARGRGTSWPKPAEREPGQIIEATILQGLISNPPTWMGVQDLSAHRLYIDPFREPNFARFDAIVVTRGKTSGLLFHGIEVKFKISPAAIRQVESLAKACDLMWLALPNYPQSDDVAALSENIGVIVVNKDGVQVIRPAQVAKGNCSSDKLAKLILERELSS